MTPLIYLIILFNLLQVSQQNDQSPFNKYIPKNWSLLDHVKGDLNKDSIEDLVLIIQSNRPSEKDEYDYEDENFKMYDRAMIILFGEAYKKNFRQISRSNSIIPHAESPQMSDPFESVTIVRGSILLKFNYWVSAGTWYTSTESYMLRYQNGDFTLIGLEYTSLHRSSMEYHSLSVNFLTKKFLCTYRINGVAPELKKWNNFTLLKLDTLTDFERTNTWKYTSSIPYCVH